MDGTLREPEGVIDFVRQHEENSGQCSFKCYRIAWMRGIESREQIAAGCVPPLTEAIFERRNQTGIWYHTAKQHYVDEYDAADVDR